MRPSRVAIGLAGALLLVGGASLYLALVSPAYWQPDEVAHVGYALRLRQGDLPSIDTAIPAGRDEFLLAASGARPRSYIYRYTGGNPPSGTYVANNPPYPYLFALPFTELTTRLDAPARPLLGMRFFSVVTVAAAVGVAFLLGRELGGQDEFVGLVTAGLLAGTISISQISSSANIDGPALLATTGVTWMLARFARRRAAGDALWLGLWSAAAAAVRPMSLVFAGAACTMAVFLAWRANGARQLLPSIVRLGAPAVLVTGWFYALNVHRYGEFTGSDALFEKLGRAPGPSLFSVLTGPRPFIQAFAIDVTEVYEASFFRDNASDYAISALGVALVLGAIILVYVSARRDTVAGRPPSLVPAAWVCSAILGVVPVVLTAQHISGGGGAHPRYLFPLLPIVAVAAALLATRVSRWLAVALVAGFVVAELTRLRGAGQLHASRSPSLPPLLRDAPVGQPLVGLAVVLAVLGAGLLLVTLVRLAGTPKVGVVRASEHQPSTGVAPGHAAVAGSRGVTS